MFTIEGNDIFYKNIKIGQLTLPDFNTTLRTTVVKKLENDSYNEGYSEGYQKGYDEGYR